MVGSELSMMGVATPHRFTVEEYHRMVQAGILVEDDRVELIEGEVVQRAPIGPAHQYAVDRLMRFLVEALGNRAIVRVGGSFLAAPDTEPEPDLQVLRWAERGYASALPGPPDLLLAVEVSDTSLRYDREVKAPLYARAGVPEYWLVDLAERCVWVFRNPTPGGYRTTEAVQEASALRLSAFPDVAIIAAGVLPPA